jgi:hypothetical protein
LYSANSANFAKLTRISKAQFQLEELPNELNIIIKNADLQRYEANVSFDKAKKLRIKSIL